MSGAYRFLQTRDGKTAFALVRLESRPNYVWKTILGPGLEGVQARYGEALRNGIDAAAFAHAQRGGAAQIVEVTALEYTEADTRPDAVKCAAALAAWKSWNHPEADAFVHYVDGEWSVSFPVAALSQ
jgi:hypothetical protein